MEEEKDTGNVRFKDYKNWIRFSSVGVFGIVLYFFIAGLTSIS